MSTSESFRCLAAPRTGPVGASSRRLGRQAIESESRMVPRSREGMWPDPQEEAGSGQPRAGLFTLLRPLTDQILSRPTRYLNAEEQSPASDIQLRVLRVP